MSRAPAIEVINVTKKFQYWSERPNSIKTVLVNMLRGHFSIGESQEFYTLRDVSFRIDQGEFVGIMGRNGAGKSTLLKIISSIYQPTSGEVKVHGKIAPLIELGAGFHPDLSGYENIFLNSSILGFGRKESKEAVDKIIEFSELGDKIYMPTKKYSSGMLVRLGFAIATHFYTPTLLIDEILAVGDEGFQRKCLDKIKQMHSEGRTIILITHDAKSVRELCTRCLVFEEQRLIFDGDADRGAEVYHFLFNPRPQT